MPVDVIGLPVGKQRYGLLLTDEGGIIDDLMFVNRGDADLLSSSMAPAKWATSPTSRPGSASVATSSRCPSARCWRCRARRRSTALSRLVPGVEKLVFMTGGSFTWAGADLFITRSGYTGEDGFEISVPNDQAEALARALLAQPEVKPVGLGARNSLRLEAGLCLYGNDIDTTTTPVEAALNWAMQKVRRTGGARAGGFPGADTVLAQLDGSLPLTRAVGLVATERVPVREHVKLENMDGQTVGEVTSGLLGPS
jgi:aminomethyltransferase